MRKINRRINIADGGVGFSEMQEFRARLSVNNKTEIRELLGSYEISFQLKLCNSTNRPSAQKRSRQFKARTAGTSKGVLLPLPTGAKSATKRGKQCGF